MKKVLILGAGGHGQVVADILLATARGNPDFSVCGFLDDDSRLWKKSFLGIPVLGTLHSIRGVSHDAVVVAIGDNRTRSRVFASLLESGEKMISAIHPGAVVGTDVRVGQGSMICAGVVVNTAAEIGESVILNTGCTVDHHCAIGSYSHIAPGAHLGGEVIVIEGAFLGIGASVIPRRRIGAWSVVGAGAVVIDDVTDGVTVVGVPAKIVKEQTRWESETGSGSLEGCTSE